MNYFLTYGMCNNFPNSTIEEAEALEASQVTCWRSHCQQWLKLEFEPKWSGSLPMFFNLFTLSSWGPDNFEGGCAAAYTNIFCHLLLGLVKKIAPSVLSLSPRISFMLFPAWTTHHPLSTGLPPTHPLNLNLLVTWGDLYP